MRPIIFTFTGLEFNVLQPRVEDVRLEDIAQSLSMQTRFAGHAREFISIAQHSVNVSMHCSPQDALWGLLHDASEAYVTDLPRGLKLTAELKNFRLIEHRIQEVIAEAFGLTMPIPKSVKDADNVELVTEWESFRSHAWPEGWEELTAVYKPRNETLISLAPAQAKELFLCRFHELRGDSE